MRIEASAPRALLVAMLLFPWGCRDRSDRAPTVTRRDTAGVAILEIAVDPTGPADLRLASVPQLTIGADDADAFQLFRVVDAELRADGTLVVANAGSSEILFFDQSGALVRTVGGSGEGPGEFQSISWIDRRPPDSLLVGDSRLRRVVVLDGSGAAMRTVNIAGTAVDESASGVFAPQAMAMFADGSLLIASYSSLILQAGPQRTETTLFRYDPAADQLSRLGSWPAAEMHLVPSEGRLAVMLPLLGRDFVVEASATVVVAASTDSPEIKLLTPDGKVSMILRWRGTERQVSREQVAREARSRLEAIPDGPLLEQRPGEIDRITTHSTAPSFGTIRIGDSGDIWIGGHALREDSTVQWLRVDPAAREVARLVIPGAARVLDVAHDRLVLLTRDDLDREIVAIHELIPIRGR